MPTSPNGLAPLLWLAGTLVAAGVVWRAIVKVVRPAWRAYKEARRRWHAAAEVIERELSSNGGKSLKDAVRRTEVNVTAVRKEQRDTAKIARDAVIAVEVLCQVVDELIERKEQDHERIWDAIVPLIGRDPRGDDRGMTDRGVDE